MIDVLYIDAYHIAFACFVICFAFILVLLIDL